ncbi:MAG: GlsB/YeaQ/YmgE family stress response membrane protein [Candidatus Limnocylindrales bacterium]
MGIISWIVLGGIAGFIATVVLNGTEGVVATIALGIVGALVGGAISSAAFDKGDVTGLNLESIVIAILGSIIVLAVVRAFTVRRSLG